MEGDGCRVVWKFSVGEVLKEIGGLFLFVGGVIEKKIKFWRNCLGKSGIVCGCLIVVGLMGKILLVIGFCVIVV